MNARIDRQLRLALHAFPTRWRTGRGDELVATATEMLSADAEGVPVPVLADIVRAGWGERLRRRPPLWRWLLYCAGAKLPARWHAWVNDDLDGRWYWLRAGLRRYVMLAGTWWVAFAVMTATNGSADTGHWSGLVGLAVVVPMSRVLVERIRRQVRKQHALPPAAGPLPPPRIVWVPMRTASPPAAPAAAAFAVWSGLVAVVMVWRTSMIDDGPVLPRSFLVSALIAAVLGGALAVGLFRHCRARADLVPQRPAMALRTTVTHVGGSLALMSVLVAFAWFQLEPGMLFPNGRFFALVALVSSVAATGVAVTRRPVTLADLIASREQLDYLRRRDMAVAG